MKNPTLSEWRALYVVVRLRWMIGDTRAKNASKTAVLRSWQRIVVSDQKNASS